mgnify:FL=1
MKNPVEFDRINPLNERADQSSDRTRAMSAAALMGTPLLLGAGAIYGSTVERITGNEDVAAAVFVAPTSLVIGGIVASSAVTAYNRALARREQRQNDNPA